MYIFTFLEENQYRRDAASLCLLKALEISRDKFSRMQLRSFQDVYAKSAHLTLNKRSPFSL